jgi:hypothetical protein
MAMVLASFFYTSSASFGAKNALACAIPIPFRYDKSLPDSQSELPLILPRFLRSTEFRSFHTFLEE